jgi:hypothetical protein
MKNQYQHDVASSFAMWIDHHLLEKGQAFENQTGILTNYSDPRLPTSLKSFGSLYKQWVYDSSISGAIVPSGVYVNGAFNGRANGLKIDYINGRVLSTGIPTNAVVTGSFAVKDYNIYLTNENEEDLIIENNNLAANKKFPWSGKYVQPYDQTIPAIYIITEGFHNTPFSMGGEDESRSHIKCVVFSDSPYSLDGVLSIFSDATQRVFKLQDFTSYPINEYGDVKSYPYAYDDYYDDPMPGSEMFIDHVVVSKLKDSRSRTQNPKSFVGFIDFEIIKYRYPRL